MDQSLKVKDFVHEWLNHFNISFQSEVKVNSTLSLDYYIPNLRIGIFIVDWKRPISVQIANKAIQLQRELDLTALYLISREISEPAQKSLDRFGDNIIAIHPNGLSELAISLANTMQQPRHMST